MAYVVTAPLVVAKRADGGFVHLYKGVPLPDDTDSDQLQQLLDAEMVAAAEPGEEAEEPGSQKPHGNANRDTWAEYARTQGASEDEVKPQDEGGLSRDDLRAKYGN
jgi:hypothetical protein